MALAKDGSTMETWVQRLNDLFTKLGPRCAVAFRTEEGQTWGKLTLFDDKGPLSVHDWPLPFVVDELPAHFAAFAGAAAENLRNSADRVGSNLTMEDVLDPAILEQADLKTHEQFVAAFGKAWAAADWVWD